MTILSGALLVVGLYISTYFTLVYYGILSAESRFVPQVCRLEERTCQTVLSTPYARVLGLPNSLLGILYYVSTLAILFGGWLVGAVGLAVVVLAWFTVALGAYLVYALLFIIRIPCPLCLTSHVINVVLAFLLTQLRT